MYFVVLLSVFEYLQRFAFCVLCLALQKQHKMAFNVTMVHGYHPMHFVMGREIVQGRILKMSHCIVVRCYIKVDDTPNGRSSRKD